jgi:hypothetical protein
MTLLRRLVLQRHWQRPQTFQARFRIAAGELSRRVNEPGLATVSVSKRQFERWYAGDIRTLPHPDSCRVLEFMFGHPVTALLAKTGGAMSGTPKFRTGRKVGRTVYIGSDDDPDGVLVGLLDTPELARLFCEAVNSYIGSRSLSPDHLIQGALSSLEGRLSQIPPKGDTR